MAIDADTTVDDILSDPKKFGLPTFKEYCTKPGLRDKLMGQDEHKLNVVDAGSQNLNRYPIDMRLRFNGFEFDCMEHLQQAAKDEGFNPWELEFTSQVVDQTANKLKIIVEYFGKRKSDILVGV